MKNVTAKLKATDKSNPTSGIVATLKMDAKSMMTLIAVLVTAARAIDEQEVQELAESIMKANLNASIDYAKKHNLENSVERAMGVAKQDKNINIEEIASKLSNTDEDMGEDEEDVFLNEIAKALDGSATSPEQSVKAKEVVTVDGKTYNEGEKITVSSPEEADKIIKAIQKAHPGVKIIGGVTGEGISGARKVRTFDNEGHNHSQDELNSPSDEDKMKLLQELGKYFYK